MFESFKNYFQKKPASMQNNNFFPVGRGRTITVSANGDMAYASCIEILAKQMAQIKWGLYGKDNKEIDNMMSQFQYVMNLQPYPGINAYEFWRYMEAQRLANGNAIAYIKPTEFGVGAPQYLVPLDSANFNIYWDNANILEGKRKIVYEYKDPVNRNTFYLLPDELIHLKAFSANGIVGRPAIEVLKDTLRSNAEVESALRSAVDNGFHGTIILSYTSDLSQSKQLELQRQVKERLSQSNRTILPLPVGMTATNISNDIKPYYDTLKTANIQAISAFFGIPLNMLNASGGYGNASFNASQMTQFYNLTIAPIIAQYANELTVKLLSERQINKGYAFDSSNDMFDFLDAQAKASVLVTYKANGILTANEARTSLKYALIDGADDLININTGGSTIGQHIGGDEGGRGNEKGE